jgi:hypothetical protein
MDLGRRLISLGTGGLSPAEAKLLGAEARKELARRAAAPGIGQPGAGRRLLAQSYPKPASQGKLQ